MTPEEGRRYKHWLSSAVHQVAGPPYWVVPAPAENQVPSRHPVTQWVPANLAAIALASSLGALDATRARLGGVSVSTLLHGALATGTAPDALMPDFRYKYRSR